MADRTAIEWTDATWNTIGGCTRVDEGCRNCYAEVMAARFNGPGQWGEGLAQIVTSGGQKDHRWTGKVIFRPDTSPDALTQPLRWKKPRRIFVNSTADTFHESVPDDWIDRIFAVMALCPQHTFQVLTKRPERAREYLAGAERRFKELACDMACDENWPVVLSIPPKLVPPASMVPKGYRVIDLTLWPLPNVWLGTSISDQASADLRIPHLLATPAAVRFLSAEPLLGPLDLRNLLVDEGEVAFRVDALDREHSWHDLYGGGRLDWVIVGGESGPGARPMHPDWARSLRGQCQAAGVPFFFKQHGEWIGVPDLRQLPDGSGPGFGAYDHCRYDEEHEAVRVGKARAGRLLDGREWNDMPGAL